MRYMKRILIGLCAALLIMLPAVGHMTASADDQPAAVQSDSSVKADDEKSQDTQQAAPQQEPETQNQGSDEKPADQ